MGRPHRHGKPPRRPSRQSVVAAGSGCLAVVMVLALHPWGGSAAASRDQVTRGEFQAAANRVCEWDYRHALTAAKSKGERGAAFVALSISTLRHIERDVSAQPHPDSLDAGLVRIRRASGELISYLEDNRQSIASHRWSPASQAPVTPLADVREAYLGLGLRSCVAPVLGSAKQR
jgi:hypothetical protein